VACWRTKAAISLKRVKIEEKLLWRAYRKSQRSFERCYARPPTASPSPRLGVHNPTLKLQSLLSQERLKLRTANLADTFTGSIRTQAHEKVWRKGSVGVSRDGPFFEYSLLSQELVKLRTSNLAGIFTGSMRTKALQKFGIIRSVGESRVLPNF